MIVNGFEQTPKGSFMANYEVILTKDVLDVVHQMT